ncbi:uncharacterized protein C8Q71DRAFT_428041 [Rhodofomes roseus]|uniref:Uncharacterized protein n=1 Tax=Rhodofomes roseus TaxID=34475 RepID=A0ABQ8KRX7_9APHY|nr:uncharacterized protein C8Q71DRAFT_428041 [Rhodofomes roseus]KAH9840880.1 hypothetical protein C8Q71DRAFT_428041 [Rhodofomes roseus]
MDHACRAVFAGARPANYGRLDVKGQSVSSARRLPMQIEAGKDLRRRCSLRTASARASRGLLVPARLPPPLLAVHASLLSEPHTAVGHPMLPHPRFPVNRFVFRGLDKFLRWQVTTSTPLEHRARLALRHSPRNTPHQTPLVPAARLHCRRFYYELQATAAQRRRPPALRPLILTLRRPRFAIHSARSHGAATSSGPRTGFLLRGHRAPAAHLR